ncbi:MAG: zinc ribbon domain-containing protein [Pirellulales bacterium]|nr:zinc ribbon domain-containing protein [Pirellulales bacterium]
MAIEFRCGQCGKLLRTGDDTAGRMAQCPECGSQSPIPFPAPPEPAAPLDVEIIEPDDAGRSPFGTSPPDSQAGENPYQSPQYAGQAGSEFQPSPAYAINRVSGPAVGLIVMGSLGLLLQIVSLFFSLFLQFGAVGNNPNAQPMPGFAQPDFGIGFAIVSHALGLGLSVLVFVGGLKMKKLENYGLSMAASIVAVIPCFSPCCLVGIPIGIWALVVLNDPYVKSSFK